MFRNKNNDSSNEINISTETFFKVGLFIIITIIAIALLKKASHALILIFLAIFLALALNAPVHAIAKRFPGKLRGSRSLATFLAFLIVVALLALFFAYITPPLVKQTESFISAAPNLVKDINNQQGVVGDIVKKYHLSSQVTKLSEQISSRIHNVGGVAFSAFLKVGNSAFAIITVLVLTYMMLVEGPRWEETAKKFIPKSRYNLADRLAREMYNVIKGYVNGQVALAALAALLISPALFLLHVSYPVALVVVIFVCGLIPMVGHTIGAIIVTIVALFHSLSAGIIILIYYIVYQQFENYIIQPKIQANSTNMSPLLVFGSLVIGVSFGGLIGGLVAIPVAGCFRILILEYLRTKGAINTPEFNKSTTFKN